MRGIKVATLGLAGATLVVALVAVLMTSVSAASHRIDVHDGTAAPGAQVTVDVGAHGMTDPGLGSWGLNILYDDSVVSVADCDAQSGSVCNPDFTTDAGDAAVRITGASAGGLEGDNVLASITFLCGASEGTSALTLDVGTLADATIGDPQDITGITTFNDGMITCEEAPPAEPTDEPMATAEPAGLPTTGISGSTGSGNGFGWLFAGLAAAGLAAIAGFGALRLSARRQ